MATSDACPATPDPPTQIDQWPNSQRPVSQPPMQQPGPQEWGGPSPDGPPEGPAPPMLARLTTFSTGVLAGVLPGSIPARSQTSPQVRSVSDIGWETSTISAVRSQRYSYLGMSNDIGDSAGCRSVRSAVQTGTLRPCIGC